MGSKPACNIHKRPFIAMDTKYVCPECEASTSRPAVRTYEQGLADGMRKMAEAACKAQCEECAAGKSISPDTSHKMPYHVNGYYCLAGKIRRAALAAGIDLSAAPTGREG